MNVLDSSALLFYVLVRLDLEKRRTLQPDSERASILLWLSTSKFLSHGTAKLCINGQKLLFCYEDLHESGSEVLCFPSLGPELS